jgi:hypothetical protein
MRGLDVCEQVLGEYGMGLVSVAPRRTTHLVEYDRNVARPLAFPHGNARDDPVRGDMAPAPEVVSVVSVE